MGTKVYVGGKRDRLAELLLDSGFAPNLFLINNNRTLTAPPETRQEAPWNLPSRLFEFPLEVNPVTYSGKLHIGLMHPLLGDHPFVKQVAAAIRPIKIKPNGAPNDSGYTQAPAVWWHALDLIGRWEDLIATRRFTTDEAIVRAVLYGLDYSKLRTDEARTILTTLEVPAPRKRIETLQLLMAPHEVKPDGGPAYWPINPKKARQADDAGALAWGRVYGIEAGWFTRKKGYLHWSTNGIAMYRGAPGQLALPL
jgi:hypothetical protein